MDYIDPHYDGPPFDLYGPGHIVALLCLAAVLWFLIWGWRNPSEAARRRGRWIMFVVFLAVELSWHAWNTAYDMWNVREHLPLHLCSLSAIGALVVLVTRNYRIYEITFFIGIAGAAQTFLTPEAGSFALPHFRAIQTLVAHGLIIVTMVYMTTIEGMRPTWSSVWKTMLFANLYLVFVTCMN